MDTDHTTDPSHRSGSVEPLAMCMVCRSEFPLHVTECPTCAVELSVVRRCPGCEIILSAKHTNCIYCGFVLQRPEDAAAPAATRGVTYPRARLRGRKVAAFLVSLGVFVAVFTLGSLLTRYEEKRLSLPPKIATTYVLRDATIYRDPIRSSAELGHLKPTDTLDIVGYRLAGQDLEWYQVAWEGEPAYAPARDFAPPKVLKASASRVLELSILQIRNPEILPLGRQAVEYYRRKFPESRDGDRLLWVLAERTRELSRARPNQELSKQARQDYEQLASRSGEMAENARRRLQQLQAAPLSSKPEKPSTPTIQIVEGSSAMAPVPKGAPTHELTLVEQTELSIRVPPLLRVAEGTVLQGRVDRPVRAGREVVVPAGSLCRLRVVQVMSDRKAALLQLISIEVGSRQLALSLPPEVVSTAANTPKPVTFRVATPLLIQK